MDIYEIIHPYTIYHSDSEHYTTKQYEFKFATVYNTSYTFIRCHIKSSGSHRYRVFSFITVVQGEHEAHPTPSQCGHE